MSTTKVLGKITRASFGFGGYQGSMFGLDIHIEWPGGGVSAPFIGSWAPSLVECDARARWSEGSRREAIGAAALKLEEILHKAKKRHVGELVGVPVECTFDGASLLSWRVLEEVL